MTAPCCDLAPGNFACFYTPGHAQHHNSYWLETEQTLFAGDVAGVLIRRGPPIPPFPPPDIHLESWKESLDKIRALKPVSLHVTHFGRVDDPISVSGRLGETIVRLGGLDETEAG